MTNATTKISLLTGANDPPYALSLTKSLIGKGVEIDFIGNDEMAGAEIARNNKVKYLNLRGSQDEKAARGQKILRILKYYIKLIRYSYETNNRVFHILWLNKFVYFDRTLLNLYYKMLGKKLIFTAHNINECKRNGNDGILNRLTLSILYKVVDHIFVHTNKGKKELIEDFQVDKNKVTVIPFCLNDTAPLTKLTENEARKLLGIDPQHKVILFFGQIAPYKGLEYLVNAFLLVREKRKDVQLIIAGKVKKGFHDYWRKIEHTIIKNGLEKNIIMKIEFIPGREIEIYFKAANVLVLPYVAIFQSGVLILSYYFGLPVIGTDVGELNKDIIDGETGYVCRAKDTLNLSEKILNYFDTPLYQNLEEKRKVIQEYAKNKYSWEKVGKATLGAYRNLMGNNS